MHAASKGALEIVCLLLTANAEKDLQDFQGTTALMYATRNGRVEVARLLLEAGADKDLHEALAFTIEKRDINFARLLSTWGARCLSPKSMCGSMALFNACALGWEEMVRMMLDYAKGCVSSSDIEIMKFFRIPNKNWQNYNGVTPLSTACQSSKEGNAAVVSMLLADGADVDTPNNAGETPLIIASKANCVDIARLLLKAGANKACRNHRGESACGIATAMGHVQIVSLLQDSSTSR